MTSGPSIVWLRNDLRLHDNPALDAGIRRGEPLVIVYIHDEVSSGMRPLGSGTKWWLHHSLGALSDQIRSMGGELVLRQGSGPGVIHELVNDLGAGAVFWNRRYGTTRELDATLKDDLRSQGLMAESFAGNLLFEPWTIKNGEGNPFRVFTPFWRSALSGEPPRAPHPAPTSLDCVASVRSDLAEDWNLLPTDSDRSEGLAELWTPGEQGARDRLAGFVENTLAQYHRRDEPGAQSTSMLSPHLRFGEISPHTIWHTLERELPVEAQKNKAKFISEVGWREFSYNILFHFPELDHKNFRPEFDRFPWGEPEPASLKAWQRGTTGVPLVDAGMRELWHTGYMHNRVRMVTASFLIKNMLVDWRVGEDWFWNNLVDADEANNPASWQWVAGSGADAAPYFRVFNPLLQAEKFDPQATYISRWVPEYDTVDYPSEPIVDLKASRDRALAAFQVLKGEHPGE
jgi:deoxyribodipyrimidine photo-lyase